MLRSQCLGILASNVRNYTTTSVQKPLKIAFFGSDHFSIHSLRALRHLKNSQPGLISDLHIVTRHAKLGGRYMKNNIDVPISSYSQKHDLNIIRAESKKEIIDLSENGYHLAIAVSYGKLIPAEFLANVKYGGLNVHPSLLPRYSGSSPLQFALLNNDPFTGVTVQNLHPTKFDKGDIILQSEEVPIAEDETFSSLRDRLGHIGGRLLTDVVQNSLFLPEHFKPPKYDYSYAGKISPSKSEIIWSQMNSHDIVRYYNTLGPLFTFKEAYNKKKKAIETRRVKLSGLSVNGSDCFKSSDDIGAFMLNDDHVVIKTIDGAIIADSLQFECFKEESGPQFMIGLKKKAGNTVNRFITT